MTKRSKDRRGESSGGAFALSGFHLEADKTGRGMSLIFSGIIGIKDFSDSFIYLLSHGGRICVNGSKLFINVYENNTVEIVGRVEGIVFKYGKD